MEQGRRIELLALAWKAKVLPLYEPCVELLIIQHSGTVVKIFWLPWTISKCRPIAYQAIALPLSYTAKTWHPLMDSNHRMSESKSEALDQLGEGGILSLIKRLLVHIT